MMGNAGIDTTAYKPHSVLSAATFAKYYDKPTDTKTPFASYKVDSTREEREIRKLHYKKFRSPVVSFEHLTWLRSAHDKEGETEIKRDLSVS